MRDNLTRYIDLLFAGAPDAADIKQEILQNTLDRYDDLLSQGKSPAAAYQLAISGIGDINEILGTQSNSHIPSSPTAVRGVEAEKPVWKKVLQAIGICLYILCPIPLFVLQNELGVCGLLTVVAIATALMVISASKEPDTAKQQHSEQNPKQELKKAVSSITWTVGVCAYFALSFATDAWYITWVIFPLTAAVQGLIVACIDLREADNNEK